MLSNRVLNLVPSATMAISAKAAELRNSGVDVINFSLGEPDFNTPANIIHACDRAMKSGYTKYTPVAGILELREAICKKLYDENGVYYTNNQITVSTGAKQAIYNAVFALVNPGDEVIVPTPCWVSYIEIIKLAGGVPIAVANLESDGFQLNIEAIEDAVTEKTKAIIINTPNNPTGAVYAAERLNSLARIAEVHNFYIISDEVYEKLIYSGARHYCIASRGIDTYNRTVVVNGLSKACSMTGWRIGYSASPIEIAPGINALQGHMTSNSTSFVQYASIEALRNTADAIEKMRLEFEKRRNYVFNALTEIDGISCANADGAFYLMPNVSSFYGKSIHGCPIHNSVDLCQYLLDYANVAAVPGSAFMAPDNIRISYTNSMENLTKGITRIAEALTALK